MKKTSTYLLPAVQHRKKLVTVHWRHAANPLYSMGKIRYHYGVL